MTVATDETAGRRGGDRERLCGLRMRAAGQGILGDIMTRKRPAHPLNLPRRTLADPTIGDRIVRKANGGRRREAIQEIPVIWELAT